MLTCAATPISPAYVNKYRLKETYMLNAATGIKTFQIQFIVITDSNRPRQRKFFRYRVPQSYTYLFTPILHRLISPCTCRPRQLPTRPPK
ncbi:MAG TPA: hypothetical protein PK239_17305 [Chitinophagales bacterium]|nr:hypothetical protein [Chitinophagales bacterium]HRK29034.1 hypothetical protein [Chitinophagales bacterium]